MRYNLCTIIYFVIQSLVCIASANEFPNVPNFLYLDRENYNTFEPKFNATLPEALRVNGQVVHKFGSVGVELQKRFAQINAIARTKFNPSIPSPALVIDFKKSANAYVSPVPVCAELSAVINPQEKYHYGYSSLLLTEFLPEQLSFKRFEKSSPCFKPSDNKLSSILEYAKSVDNLLMVNDQCKLDPLSNKTGLTIHCNGVDSANRSQSIEWLSNAPYIFMDSSLLRALGSWSEFDAIIAHELGHYYLGHTVGYNTEPYFYEQSRWNGSFNPPKNARAESIGAKLRVVGNVEGILHGGYPGLYSSKFTGEILKIFANKIDLGRYNNFRDFLIPENGCEYLSDERNVQTNIRANLLFRLADANLALSEIPEIVADFANCIKKVTLRGENLQLKDYLSLLGRGDFAISSNSIGKFFSADELAQPVQSLARAFEIIDEKVTVSMHEIYQSPEYQNLGFYTYEGEADIFAANLLQAIGSSSMDLQSTLVSIVKSEIDQGDEENEAKDLAACLNSRDNKWQVNGIDAWPAIKNFENMHHEFCYRLFNLDRMKQSNTTIFNRTKLERPKIKYQEVIDYFSNTSVLNREL